MNDYEEEFDGLETDCVHAGEAGDPQGAVHGPVYNSTTFRFDSTAELLETLEGGHSGAFYTRYGMNPTIQALETKLAVLEGAESALAFGAGMAAQSALFLAHGRGGILCIGDAYGGTIELLSAQLPLLGIPSRFLLADELDSLEEVLEQGVDLVFFETPTNPTLEVFDIAGISARAHAAGALVAVDNTFATPINQQPLALGADLVVHSATKYLGGHSDITAGAIMGSRNLLEPIWSWRKNLGQVPAPETAALLMRSLRTLAVRVRQHNASARAVAETLCEHPRVTRVLYPGLPEFAGFSLARQQMHGFGGMVTFEVDGDGDETADVVDRLRLFTIAPSLGGVESLVTQPVTTTHYTMAPEERERRGITESMIRLSVGLEDADDLVDDLLQALD